MLAQGLYQKDLTRTVGCKGRGLGLVQGAWNAGYDYSQHPWSWTIVNIGERPDFKLIHSPLGKLPDFADPSALRVICVRSKAGQGTVYPASQSQLAALGVRRELIPEPGNQLSSLPVTSYCIKSGEGSS